MVRVKDEVQTTDVATASIPANANALMSLSLVPGFLTLFSACGSFSVSRTLVLNARRSGFVARPACGSIDCTEHSPKVESADSNEQLL
jgi:hypothetical protein